MVGGGWHDFLLPAENRRWTQNRSRDGRVVVHAATLRLTFLGVNPRGEKFRNREKDRNQRRAESVWALKSCTQITPNPRGFSGLRWPGSGSARTAPPAAAQAAPPAKRHVITDSGAVGDGQTLNTKAIQAVIDRCAAGGGGVVVVPKGVFLSGALFFKNGVNLLVEPDGVLKGSVNPDDYPQVNTRWEGVEREWTCAFLNFNDMTNVVVSGAGMIDGSGDLWMQRGGGGRPRRAPGDVPAGTNAPPAPPRTAPAQSGSRRGRPRMICFTHCKNVRHRRPPPPTPGRLVPPPPLFPGRRRRQPQHPRHRAHPQLRRH